MDTPLRYEVVQEVFVDETRPTPDAEGGVAENRRVLATDLYLPAGPGPYPLLVVAHGRNGHPGRLSGLLGAWARAGYVVAAPAFPGTNDQAPALVVADYVSQPGDLSFLIDELLSLAAPGQRLDGLIDPERVGAAGHSLGGGTVWGLTFNTCCRDARIDAAIVMASLQFPYSGEYLNEGPPLLIVHGTEDTSLPYDSGVAPYGGITTPKMLLTLTGGTHSDPVEDVPSPHDDVVVSVTTDFWEAVLRADPGARSRLAEGAVDGLATVSLDL